ncbi:hypothetical protein N7527_000337 [Penicillium freii]|nr:hypothetical protein N7527_000337 [Penicillium freii]
MRTPSYPSFDKLLNSIIVGDIAYDSIVTEREERLPVAVSVIGPPGADLILVDLVEKGMKGAGLATEVKTGSSMY